MATNLKKKILVTAELASSPAGAFFQELGFEMYYKHIEGNTYSFVINNACPDVTNVPRLQIGDDLETRYSSNVRSYVSMEMLASPKGRKLLASYFTDALEFDLTDRYSKDLKDIYTIKIHDYLNLGFFVDKIITEAYKAHFDISALRNYLNLALNFAFKKIESSKDILPIDICFSHNGEAFAVEISLKTDSFHGKPEFSYIFDEVMENVSYFDVTYFHKKNKLTLSSLSFKDPALQSAKAYFFTEVTKRSLEAVKSNANSSNEATVHLALDMKEGVPYKPQTGISDYVQKRASSNLDECVEKIKASLANKSLNDIEAILSQRNDNQNDIQRIQKWGGENRSEERWEIKRLQINDKIEAEVQRVRTEGRNIVQDDIVRVVAQELETQDHDVLDVVNEIVTEVVSAEVINKKEMEEAFAQKLLGMSSNNPSKDKLESQVARMKKIMDQMKAEITKLKNEKIASDFEQRALSLVDNSENTKLKTALSRTMEALRAKDFLIEKYKRDFEATSKLKDQRIFTLETKLEELKAEFAKNQSMGHKEHEAGEKQEKEIETLRSNLHIAQAVIERLRSTRAPEEKDNFSIGPLLSDLQAKEALLQTLSSERKAMEEKIKTQSMDLKKVEQKLKFTISQLATANKQKAASSGQKTSEAHVKQLEQANARMSEASADVSEKRKEIVKLKQENGMLASKVAELEKKIANLDKKAA